MKVEALTEDDAMAIAFKLCVRWVALHLHVQTPLDIVGISGDLEPAAYHCMLTRPRPIRKHSCGLVAGHRLVVQLLYWLVNHFLLSMGVL